MSAAARPQVSVFSATEGESKVVKNVSLPDVLTAPVRPDIISFVHSQMNKNKRQAYCVKDQAGMDYAAESWGTGRAVSRIPRVPGGGTHRAGQAAFGNMCRGGRMFHPTRIWRKWHRKISVNHRRYALCSALAASAVPALVMARGHRVSEVPELPLVIGGSTLGDIKKTKQAVKVLESFGIGEDIARVKASKTIRPGVGKMRNRRYIKRRGPLVIHASTSADLSQAFRNIEGVDMCHVDRLNLLQLAPGGHLGRLVVWTDGAFERLDALYGTHTSKSTEKVDYSMPSPMVKNTDITRIINSDEIRKVVRPARQNHRMKAMRKKNPLKNRGVMLHLNPYADAARKAEIEYNTAKRTKTSNSKAARKAFYKKMME